MITTNRMVSPLARRISRRNSANSYSTSLSRAVSKSKSGKNSPACAVSETERMGTDLKVLIPIALGGALGAIMRYLASLGIHGIAGTGFPYGTLLVNVLGSFLIGVLYVVIIESPAGFTHYRAPLIVGLLGAFTTFSAFSLETAPLRPARSDRGRPSARRRGDPESRSQRAVQRRVVSGRVLGRTHPRAMNRPLNVPRGPQGASLPL